jgi:glycerol-3-phosphate dehydrogenase (NAD(P)+)
VPKIAVIGATTWGTTLGVTWAQKGHYVRLLARSDEEAEQLRTNRLYNLPLPSGRYPARLYFTASPQMALDGVRAAVIVVPAQTMRQNVRQIRYAVNGSMLVVSASKGLEVETGKRMTEVITEELAPECRPNVCVLSGPNLAREILQEHPAATVVANEDIDIARAAQRLLNTRTLCVYTNTDVTGVELSGALKNIIALAAGVADGLGYGDNAKSALMTRGWAEITALGMALGANPLTFSGLSGLGDMIATCASPLSRNHHVGMELAKGRKLEEITDEMDNVAEGVGTTVAAYRLAQKLGIGMPITEKMYRVLYAGLSPQKAAEEILNAETHHELEGRKWKLMQAVRKRNGKS